MEKDMKKAKGLLMGIAALALLFSMTVLGCESATGPAGDPGDGRELQQHLKVYSNFETVVMGSGTGTDNNVFYAVYEGIDLVTNPRVIWEVFGTGNGDLDGEVAGIKYKNGRREKNGSAGTYMVEDDPLKAGWLVVDPAEEALSLTVYATYGGYTESKTVTVGVPKMTGLTLIKGKEIGTTNIWENGYTETQKTLDTTATEDVYLVYKIEDKERTSVRRDEEITGDGFAKVNSSPSPGTGAIEFDIPIAQEKWLTIYQVPRSGGVASTDHVKAQKFISLAASKGEDATTYVKLPSDESVTVTSFTQPTAGVPTVNAVTAMTGKTTSAVHGAVGLSFTAYAVYYDPAVYKDLPDGRPGLNTRFIPPTGSVNFEGSPTGLGGFNRTGTWQIILQYTGNVTGTGNGAWCYANTIGYEIKDAAAFSGLSINRGNKGNDPANTVHISLEGKTFVEEYILQQNPTWFGVTPVHISRDSDTGVTLYLNNSDRTVATEPTVTISSDAFAKGTYPRATVGAVDPFIRISSSDQKYVYATISGIQPPYTFAFGAASPALSLNYSTAPGFIYGDPQTTLDAGTTFIPGADLIITWYYVNGSTWVDTGITGLTFTPVDTDAKGKTLGIRVTVNPANNPYVTLVDANEVTIDGHDVTKWTTIEYGQRILGAIANTP
jgi:hypothetical protein